MMTSEQLKALRTKLGYSQQKMARELDVNIRTFQRWEYGERKISKFVESHIERVFEVKLEIADMREELERMKK